MDLKEGIHARNLLCGANLSDNGLCIVMGEVDGDTQDTMYDQVKTSLNKYFGCSGLANSAVAPTPPVQLITPKQEPMYASIYLFIRNPQNYTKFHTLEEGCWG